MKIILTYVDSEELAEKIAETLLQEKLAACVGFWPGKSRYWWKGKIERNDNELSLIIKTKESLVGETMQRITELHSYDQPVIEVVNVEKVNPGTEEWIEEVLRK